MGQSHNLCIDRFMNDDDRKLFLATLAQACEKTGCLVHTATEVA